MYCESCGGVAKAIHITEFATAPCRCTRFLQELARQQQHNEEEQCKRKREEEYEEEE